MSQIIRFPFAIKITEREETPKQYHTKQRSSYEDFHFTFFTKGRIQHKAQYSQVRLDYIDT
jgi:hypothetical protein